MIPLDILDEHQVSMADYEFSLLEVNRGSTADSLALTRLDWLTYEKPIAEQEYLAVRGLLRIIRYKDNNEVQAIYPSWNLTLRFSDGGDDTWSVDPLDRCTEGYPPIECDAWVFFLVRKGSEPYLYFQPELSLMQELGVRTSGAYFLLPQE